MDNPSNLDGFDGLPLDLWINQFQPHQENPSSVFHHPASQPLRDYSLLTNRTMPVAFPIDDALAQVGQSSQHMNSSILAQYGLSLPGQSEHQHSSHERSAWSHMMSLDQSMGSYGSHDQGRLVQNRYSPLDDLVEKTREDSLIKSHAISSFPSHNLPRASFTSSVVGSSVPESHNNYFQHPLLNSSQEKGAQHLGQLMNLSKTSSNMEKASHALSVVTDMSTLESSGEYSPVSPPTITAAEKPSTTRLNINPARPGELLLRDNDCPSLSSSDPTDIFTYFSKMDSCPTDLSSHSTQDSKLHTHLMHSSAAYNELPSPSDTPLDMTTAISTKTGKNQTMLPKLITSPVTFESSAQPLSNTLAGHEKLPLLQTLLNKGKVISNDSVNVETVSDSGTIQQQLELSIPSNVKLVKPLKSTPKKSNFYGRDASLFSFPSQEPPNDSSQSFVADIPSKTVDSKSDDVKEDRSLGKNNLDKCENSFTDAWEHTSQEDASNMDLTSVDNQSDSSIFPINSSDSSFTSGFSSSLAQSIDSFIEESTRKVVESDNIPVARDEKSSLLSSEVMESKENEMTNNSLDMSCENIEEPEHVNDLEEEFSPALPIQSKAKPGKGKKRKATGFPAKPKKQPGRKRGRAQNSKAVLVPVEPLSTEDIQVEEMVQPLVLPVPKKKRGAPKARADPKEVMPRRSSSRKSKDNAMRLIELQADSNYGGFRQSDEEQPAEKKSLRSSKRTTPNKVATEISGELSEPDSVEDKSDDDYEMDEEETKAVDKNEIVQDESPKIKSTERKLGGLKISIKLSGNSSAEIVSGIADSPVKKKRKVVKKKNSKAKNKMKIISEELSENGEKDAGDTNQEIKEIQSEEKVAGSLDATEKHMSLIDKYFSSANSATVARQTQKSSSQMKGKKMKKKVTAVGVKLKASKGPKKIDEDPGGKQKSSVKFDLDNDGKTEKGLDKEDLDSNTPKFVCGYCPQRYHSKQDLMAHMEDHMMEMEGKDSASVGVDEKKKLIENLGSAAVSRDPRANRTPTNGNNTQPTNKQIVPEKKAKLVVELDKDFDVKNELAKTKFRCGECGEMFTSKPGLLDHVRIHTADKPFECDICHKCFTEIKLLSAHRKTHVPEKLLRCHMCSKAFVDKADLNHHMQSHPKRSGMNLPGKFDLVPKKTFKKSPQDTQDKSIALPPKKPTSFASALSGEIEASDKDSTAPLVLLLKRGVEMSSTPVLKTTTSSSSNSIVGKSISSEAKLTSKPAQLTVPKVKVNVSEIKTKQSETKGKDVEKPVVTKSENKPASSDVPANKTESIGVCNCKECPECVTRFLQSFE